MEVTSVGRTLQNDRPELVWLMAEYQEYYLAKVEDQDVWTVYRKGTHEIVARWETGTDMISGELIRDAIKRWEDAHNVRYVRITYQTDDFPGTYSIKLGDWVPGWGFVKTEDDVQRLVEWPEGRWWNVEYETFTDPPIDSMPNPNPNAERLDKLAELVRSCKLSLALGERMGTVPEVELDEVELDYLAVGLWYPGIREYVEDGRLDWYLGFSPEGNPTVELAQDRPERFDPELIARLSQAILLAVMDIIGQ